MLNEIIERSQKPVHFGKIDNSLSDEEENAICGDHIQMFVVLENGKIKDAKFSGKGCSICIASADMLLDYAIGKSIKEIEKLDETFIRNMIKIPLGINRIKCALLPLNVLKKTIKKK
ncbi:MAG: iron-sulfur cluster assembly scaffold protein [Candidatus Woesearchaeota archaeon]